MTKEQTMADEATTKAPGDEPVATPADAPKGDEPGKVYTQGELDNITRAQEATRLKLEKQLAAAQKQADEARRAALSEDEKKLEEAKKAGAAEVSALLETERRARQVERALIAKGVPVDKLERAAQLVGSDAEDVGVAVEAFAKDWPEFFQTKQLGFGGGGGRNTGPGEPDYSPEGVQARIAQPGGKAWFEAHRAKIKQWRAEHGYPA